VELPRRRWLLGENLLAHYVVKNVSKQPVPIAFGGDYRGSSRARRFTVVAFDSAGQEVADPDPRPHHFGGLGMDKELAPGDELAFSLQLMRYCRFDRPGTYRIRIAHDLGWGGEEQRPGPEDKRWAEVELELAIPTAAEARAVVDAMAALPDAGNHTWGERAPAFADFTTLRLPAYLPLLELRLDRTGDLRALTGIAANTTTPATNALIRLTEHHRADIAGPALQHLLRRMPRTTLKGEPRFEDPGRDYLVEESWRDRFAPTVRKLAARLLSSGDATKQIAAAGLLDAAGTKDDLPMVLDAADVALAASKSEPLTFPRPRSASESLVRVMQILVSRGAEVPDSPTRASEVSLYIAHWGPQANRPKDYAARATGWLSHDVPMIRFFVLEETAPPLEPTIVAQLPTALKNTHPAISVKACDAISASKAARFRNVVASRIRVVRDEWLIRCLNRAAFAVGMPGDDIARAWVARLDDVELTMAMFASLQAFIEHRGGSGMSGKPDEKEAKRLKASWSRFVRVHQAALRAGKHFSIGGPELTKDLVPKGFVFHRPNQPDWP